MLFYQSTKVEMSWKILSNETFWYFKTFFLYFYWNQMFYKRNTFVPHNFSSIADSLFLFKLMISNFWKILLRRLVGLNLCFALLKFNLGMWKLDCLLKKVACLCLGLQDYHNYHYCYCYQYFLTFLLAEV